MATGTIAFNSSVALPPRSDGLPTPFVAHTYRYTPRTAYSSDIATPECAMKLLFWLSLRTDCLRLLRLRHLALDLLSAFTNGPFSHNWITPTVSIVIAARNEEANLPSQAGKPSPPRTTHRTASRLLSPPMDRQIAPPTSYESKHPHVLPVILRRFERKGSCPQRGRKARNRRYPGLPRCAPDPSI